MTNADTPPDAVTIRVGANGNYQDIYDAAKYHAKKHGGMANALACMARESEMYAEWRREGARAASKRAKGASAPDS